MRTKWKFKTRHIEYVLTDSGALVWICGADCGDVRRLKAWKKLNMTDADFKKRCRYVESCGGSYFNGDPYGMISGEIFKLSPEVKPGNAQTKNNP